MAWWRGGVVAWWRGGVVAWWRGGVVAWWRGGVVAWWRGGVVAWWRGGVVAWWRGGVVAWWRGGVVAWWRGGVVAWWRGGVVAWWRGGVVHTRTYACTRVHVKIFSLKNFFNVFFIQIFLHKKNWEKILGLRGGGVGRYPRNHVLLVLLVLLVSTNHIESHSFYESHRIPWFPFAYLENVCYAVDRTTTFLPSGETYSYESKRLRR